MSQMEVWALKRNVTELGMASGHVTFPSLLKISDLVVHSHVSRENVTRLRNLSKKYIF
jgi:hypothetical protein